MSDYIAEQYAKRIALTSIEFAAQDQAYESVWEMAQGDGLELTDTETEALVRKVEDIMSSRLVITFN